MAVDVPRISLPYRAFAQNGYSVGFVTAEGVTYSSYGTGAKPEIYGSPENGSGAEKWSLLSGTDNIWVFYRELQDCGGILLDGETVAQKYTPFWDSSAGKWLDFGEKASRTIAEALSAPEFDVTTLSDLRFFNSLENVVDSFPAYCWGKLYLRCDAGNPGEIYDSIEFFTSLAAGAEAYTWQKMQLSTTFRSNTWPPVSVRPVQ